MRTLVDHLAQYAAYHRDRRNIATHFVGIPAIVVAVTVLLARPAVDVGGWAVTPAAVVALATTLFYLRLDLRYGLVMGALLAASVAGSLRVAALPTGAWLATGLGLFVAGWIVQFVGHWYEGRKPAFVDDLVGLVVGPLFVVAELGFALGLRTEVLREIEARVGPTRIRPARATSA